MNPEEQALLDAWRVANEVWQADVFNKEKEAALDRAADALNRWRRVETPEGRAYADSPKTYADETGDNAPDQE
jgi:hypothetical protein